MMNLDGSKERWWGEEWYLLHFVAFRVRLVYMLVFYVI